VRYLSWLVTFPVMVVVVVFAVANRQEVTLHFWPLAESGPVPVWLLVLGSFLAGILVGWLIMWVATAPRRRRARQTAERARELARQLAELRRQQAAQPAGAAAPATGALAAPRTPAAQPGHGGAALESVTGR
jgi:uncharacterized integral membrane protein